MIDLIMARELQLKLSPEGQLCIKENDFTVEEMNILKTIMNDRQYTSENYNIKGAACAFFQMGYENDSGPAMIEFWNPNRYDCQKFVDYVNVKFKG